MGGALKIVRLSDAKLEATPIQVGSDPAEMKSDDTITTQVMPLSSADAKQLVKDLKDFVPTIRCDDRLRSKQHINHHSAFGEHQKVS